MSGKLPIAGKSLSIGGPNSLLPDLPEKILQLAKHKKSIPIIIGTTKSDGSFPTTGKFSSVKRKAKHHFRRQNNPIEFFSCVRLLGDHRPIER